MPSGTSHGKSIFHTDKYFTNPFGFISMKKALAKASAFFLAEDKGFEPSRRVSDLLP